MDKSAVSVYNDRLIQIESFSFSDSSVIEDLDFYLYTGTWGSGNNVGFAFDMPFYEYSLGCGNCVNTVAFSVSVNNSPYIYSSEVSAYSMQAQPDTGFMYSMAKDSTVVLNLQYYTNSSQPNQY